MVSRLSHAVVAALMLLALGSRNPPAEAGDGRTPGVHVAGADTTARFLPLGIGKSVVVDLARDIKDVLVANPAIANAVVRSARRAYLIGVTVGQTNVYFFDAEGRQIAGFDIAVTRDLNGVRAALRGALPEADVRIEGVGDGVVLTGSVGNAGEAQQAVDVAARLVGESGKVVNGLTIRGRDQVTLKVTVAEVQRSILKQLGINFDRINGGAQSLGSAGHFLIDNPFSANPLGALSNTAITVGTTSVAATLRAMERAGVLRTLAEPNLTAISGENATFLAGGEFPVPGGFTCSPATTTLATSLCQVEVQFKKFGVGLNFTPVVLSGGRISLRILSEVSEVTNENALTLQQAGQNVTIPGIRTRRSETTVEIPSGGSLAMAGMIQQQTKQHINGLPGLMDLPVLGALFRSRDYINNTTELMIIVTPYIVRAVAQKELSLPDDGYADASDPATILLGRLTRIYGVAGHPEPHGAYHGTYGFILE